MTGGCVQVKDLSFRYPAASEPALRGMSFNIEEGEIFGFLGPSGAGKSTTQRVLLGLLRGWSGEITMLGKPLREWRAADYRRVGVSFESPNHYLKLSARENLGFFAALYPGCETESPESVLSEVGLLEAIDQRVESFSKGMKNRLNLARSLLHRPELWFLDEPTSGLDPVSARRIRELIEGRRQRGVTVFMTTHDMQTADLLCDRVAFVVDGTLAVTDAPRRLRLRYGQREIEVAYGQEGRRRERFPLDGLSNNMAFMRILREERIETLHSQETTLEDVFVKVTGRGLG